MNEKLKGQRIEYFSDADVIAHGREARRKGRPIWTNPFLKERAALWRKAWHRSHNPVEQANLQEDARFTKIGTPKVTSEADTQ